MRPIILFIANAVFPKAALPDSSFITPYAARRSGDDPAVPPSHEYGKGGRFSLCEQTLAVHPHAGQANRGRLAVAD